MTNPRIDAVREAIGSLTNDEQESLVAEVLAEPAETFAKDAQMGIGIGIARRLGRGPVTQLPPFPSDQPPAPPYLVSIDIVDLPPGALAVGGTGIQLVAIGHYSDGTEKTIIANWTSNTPLVGSVSSTGVFTPAATGAGGLCPVTAESSGVVRTEDLAVSGEAPYPASVFLYLTDPNQPLTAARILGAGSSEVLKLGTKDQYGAIIATAPTVQWSSDNPAVLTASGSGQNGTILGVATGATIIRAKNITDANPARQPETQLSYSVPSTAQVPTSVIATPSSISNLQVGQSIDVILKTLDANGVEITTDTHTALSANTGIATVAMLSNPERARITAVAIGTVTITGKSVADPTKTVPISTGVVGAPSAGQADSASGRNPNLGMNFRQWMYQMLQVKALWDADPTASTGTLKEKMAKQFYSKIRRVAGYINYNSIPGGNPAGLYDSNNTANAILYQVTGNVADARYGIDYVIKQATATLNDNAVREHTISYAFLYDWLYQAMTPSERTTAANGLKRWTDYILGNRGEFIGLEGAAKRYTDSDETTGCELGLLCAEQIDTPETRAAGLYQNLSNQTVYGGVAGGGLTSTAADMATLRNRLRSYIEVYAAGGEWLESSHYNAGTTSLLCWGVWLLRAVVPGAIPEFDAWVDASANYIIHQITLGLTRQNGWGDSESIDQHNLRPEKWMVALCQRALFTAGSTNGKLCQKMVEHYYTNRKDDIGLTGTSGSSDGDAAKMQRILTMYNPINPSLVAESGAFPWEAGSSSANASGVGHTMIKHADGGFVHLHGYNTLFEGLDHRRKGLSDFRMMIGEDFVLDRPEGYGGNAVNKLMQNDTLIAGLYQAFITRPNTVFKSGTAAGVKWWATIASDAGPYDTRTYNQWPGCLTIHRRIQVHFRDPATGYLITNVYELLQDLKDPAKATPYPGNLGASNVAVIDAARTRTAGAMVEQQWWPREASMVISGNLVTWDSRNGTNRARLVFLAPTMTIQTYPPKTWVPDNITFTPTEATGILCLRARPSGGYTLDGSGFLNTTTFELNTVAMAGPPGTPPTAALVGGNAQVSLIAGRTITFLSADPWVSVT